MTSHELLLELLTLGLSWVEANSLGYEEALCLLWHARHKTLMQAIDSEALRLASLPFAEPHELLKSQSSLRHRQARQLADFHRRQPRQTQQCEQTKQRGV